MEKSIDPRTLRSRKLIMDAFIELSMKKEFKDITIKDITSVATVNRATFYNHFFDKYHLMEKVLSESLMRSVFEEVNTHGAINDETIESIFLSITKFLTSISNQCRRSYEAFTPQIETLFKNELQEFFTNVLETQSPNQSEIERELSAIMLSWSLYGSAMHWMQNQTGKPEDYVKEVINFMKKGVNL